MEKVAFAYREKLCYTAHVRGTDENPEEAVDLGAQTDKRAGIRAATGVGVFWLAVFPLISGFSYSGMTRAKWLILAAAAPAGLALMITLSAMRRAPRPAFRRSPPLWALAGYLGWMTLSALLGSQGLLGTGSLRTVLLGSGRYEGLLTLILYASVFLSLSLAAPRADVLQWAVAGGLLAFAAVVVLQYAGHNPLGLYPAGRSVRTNYEFQGTIGNIDMSIGYLSLTVPSLTLPWLLRGGPARAVCFGVGLAGFALILFMEVQAGLIAMGALGLYVLALALRRPSVRPRAALLFAAACLCGLLRLSVRLPWLDGGDTIALVLPQSRAAMLLLSASLLIGGLVPIFRFFPGPRCPRWLAAAVPAALCAAVILALALAPIPPEAGGLWEAHELLNGRAQDGFGSERVGVWRALLEILRTHPLLGTGPDGFRAELPAAARRLGIALTQSFDNPHNLFLCQAVSGGVPGLLLYLALTALLLVRCARRGNAGRVLAGCILCWLVQGFFTFSICLTSPMAWAIFGLTQAPVSGVRKRRGSDL